MSKRIILNLDEGCIYVVEPVGSRHPFLKVGKTGLVLKVRLRPGTTFAPKGLRVLRMVRFPDKGLAETNIHRKLQAYHCAREVCGDAAEMFEANLAVIDQVLAEELAYQKALFQSARAVFKRLEASKFFEQEPAGVLTAVLEAKIYRDISLKEAIIRVINSTSFEGPLERVLARAGISFDNRNTRAMVENPSTLLSKLKIKTDAQDFHAAFSRLSHIDGGGLPKYAEEM